MWNSHLMVLHCQQIERVQRKSLSFVGLKLNIVQLPHDYTPVLQNFNLLSFADRRTTRDLTFLRNILYDKIDSLTFLQHVNMLASEFLRALPVTLFHLLYHLVVLTTKVMNSLLDVWGKPILIPPSLTLFNCGALNYVRMFFLLLFYRVLYYRTMSK